MNPLDEIKQFVEDRNEALLSRDFRTVQTFHEKWNPDLPRMPDMVPELAMHKARTAVLRRLVRLPALRVVNAVPERGARLRL